MVNNFDLQGFGHRQFKIAFAGKGSVFLSGADLLEMTDKRSEVQLLFDPDEVA